jgi:predicted SprT family Zn-dependent metalloprotease
MDLNKTEKLAIKLMDKHGLLDKGWCFEFDNSVRRFGVCKYYNKTIGLSKKLVEINDEDKVKDTILHEIAHAIVGRGNGHGQKWKDVCVQIGAKPERCYDTKDTNIPTLKYSAVCKACGTKHEKARLKYKNARRSCKCQSGKDWNNRVLLEFKQNY